MTVSPMATQVPPQPDAISKHASYQNILRGLVR